MLNWKNRGLALAALVVVALSSCKTTKDIQKTKTDTKTETVINTVTTKTITETAVEDVKIKSDSVMGESDDLETDPIVIENENIKLIVTKDKKTGKTKAKAIQKEKTVPVNIKRVIVENTHENKKIKSREITKTKEKSVERTGGLNLNWLWWLLLLLLIPLWRYRHQLLGTKR